LWLPGPLGIARERVEAETALVDALTQFSQVVALDRSDEHFGAGRGMIVDDLWEVAIAKLVRDSVAVLLLPGSSTGLTKELELLRSGEFVTKILFMMPPCNRELVPAWSAKWAAASSTFAAILNVQLPTYSAAGMLFTVGASGAVDATVEFPSTMQVTAIAGSLDALLKKVQAKGSFRLTNASGINDCGI
jgi:hypothetical protein